jgi:hypothetical protein
MRTQILLLVLAAAPLLLVAGAAQPAPARRFASIAVAVDAQPAFVRDQFFSISRDNGRRADDDTDRDRDNENHNREREYSGDNTISTASDYGGGDYGYGDYSYSEAPLTYAPATEAPITYAPTTEAPITQEPITYAPDTDDSSRPTEAPSTITPSPTADVAKPATSSAMRVGFSAAVVVGTLVAMALAF